VLSLESADGQAYKDSMYLTIHKIPEENDTIFLNNKLVLGSILVLLAISIGWIVYRKKSLKIPALKND
jgi:hypothetical protein